LQPVTHVSPSTRPAAAESARTSATPRPAPAENAAENVAYIAVAKFKRGPAMALPETTRPAPCAAVTKRHFGIAVFVYFTAIILGTLILVAQQVIRRGNLSEPFRSFRIVLIAIRMKFLGEFAVRFLDRGVVRAPRYAKP